MNIAAIVAVVRPSVLTAEQVEAHLKGSDRERGQCRKQHRCVHEVPAWSVLSLVPFHSLRCDDVVISTEAQPSQQQ
jgi:hypothetical protein